MVTGTNPLSALSDSLVEAVEKAGKSTVLVNGTAPHASEWNCVCNRPDPDGRPCG